MTKLRRLLRAAVLIVGSCPAWAQSGSPVEIVIPAFRHSLPNLQRQTVTGLIVTFPPGGRSPTHHHAGSVVAYMLSGAVRSENSATGPVRVYRTGESFFEPLGSTHLVCENASATEPASLLAIFVAEDGAMLKTDEK